MFFIYLFFYLFASSALNDPVRVKLNARVRLITTSLRTSRLTPIRPSSSFIGVKYLGAEEPKEHLCVRRCAR